MASSNGFDGYNLAPAFTLPAQQSFANLNYPFNPADDPLPEPWPPAANKWVFPTTLCIPPDQPGTSRLPAEVQGWPPLDEGYASSSLSPAPDLSWGGIPLPSTTFTGSSRSTAQDNQANQEPYRSSLPAHDDPASSWNYFSRPIESFSKPFPEDTPDHLAHRRDRTPTGAEKENPAPIPARDAIDENSFGVNLHRSPGVEAQEWAGASSGLYGPAELLESTQIIASLPTMPRLSRTRASNPAGPSSLPASRSTILPAASGPPAAARSRRKVPTAVAGPSRLALTTPSETTVQAEAATLTELRRSSRKRTVPANCYAEASVPPPPPSKKRKAANGMSAKARDSASAMASSSASEYGPVARPSRQAGKSAVSSPAANPSTRKACSVAARTKAKRPRRTRERVDKHKVPDMPSLPCDVVGCTRVWDPYTHDENRKHLQKHFDAGDLESEAGLVCVFDVCQEGVPGKDLLRHMEENHIGLPYLCPIRCGWRASRSSRQMQHMRTAHKAVEWEP